MGYVMGDELAEKWPSGWNPRVVFVEGRVKVIAGFQRAVYVSVPSERLGVRAVRRQFRKHASESAGFEFRQTGTFAPSNVRI
jgi:hypothetical protein